MLYLGHHTFSCLRSSVAALVPWDSAAQSGWCRAEILNTCSTVRENRREAVLLHRRPELPPQSATNVGSKGKGHKTRSSETQTQRCEVGRPRPVQLQTSSFIASHQPVSSQK